VACVPEKKTMHRKATTRYWSALHLGAALLLALVTSSPAVAGSLGVPMAATDWILTLDAPDTVYPGGDIATGNAGHFPDFSSESCQVTRVESGPTRGGFDLSKGRS
jgi:hypothetical protein